MPTWSSLMGAPSESLPRVAGHHQGGNRALTVGKDGLATGGAIVGIDVGQAAGRRVLNTVNGHGHAQDVPVEFEGFVKVADTNGDVRYARKNSLP